MSSCATPLSGLAGKIIIYVIWVIFVFTIGHEATNQFKRTDITIINRRNLKIEGSYFKKIT